MASDHPACGDCERLRPGLIAQPVNAASCVAFLAAAGALWHRVRRRGTASPEAALFCGLVAANGLGGIAFHGPGDRASHWLHDSALVGTLAAIAVDRAGPAAGIAGASAVALALRPDATNAASLVGTALVVGGEVSRRHRPTTRMGALLLAAAGVNLLTRTGGRWCRPEARLQGHALWHVLTAAALYEWGADTFGRRG